VPGRINGRDLLQTRSRKLHHDKSSDSTLDKQDTHRAQTTFGICHVLLRVFVLI